MNGDEVTIYQGASFVGDSSPGRRYAGVGNGVLIGSGARICADAVATHEVAADTTVVGINK